MKSACALALLGLVFALACAGGPSSSAGPGATPPEAKRPDGKAAAPSYDAMGIVLLRRMRDGKQLEVAKLDKRLSELNSTPISLVARRVAGAPGEPESYDQRLDVGTEKKALPRLTLSCDKPAQCLAKEWLRFELRGPGASRVIERVLYERGADEDVPVPGYRRHTITILTGAVARADVQKRIREDHAALGLDQRKAKAKALEQKGDDALAELDALDVGGTFGHELALAFAAESDALTERLAATFGVEVGRETPRVLIASAEAEGSAGQRSVSLDLRLDEVRAEAADPAVARLFQLSRGLEESALEARLIDHLLGKSSAVSTARLMAAARKQGIELGVLTPERRDGLGSLGAPPRFLALVEAALAEGHDVILPRAAVDLAGRRRWGFWRVERASGMTVGVMEGGQHQGMVDYTKTVKKAALDEKKAFFIGLHAGFIQSEFMYAAAMLKYGEVTPLLIQEIKNTLKDSACSACPQVGIGAEVPFKLGEDCYKKALFGLEKKLEFGFCDSYNNGFKCAVGMLIASLEKKNQLPMKVEPEASIKLGCTELKVGGGD